MPLQTSLDQSFASLPKSFCPGRVSRCTVCFDTQSCWQGRLLVHEGLHEILSLEADERMIGWRGRHNNLFKTGWGANDALDALFQSSLWQ
eukprot:9952210-Karenia_brevis.AAC.1